MEDGSSRRIKKADMEQTLRRIFSDAVKSSEPSALFDLRGANVNITIVTAVNDKARG